MLPFIYLSDFVAPILAGSENRQGVCMEMENSTMRRQHTAARER